METRHLTARFGLELSGIDLNDPPYATIRALFEAHSVLLFREQSLTPAKHIALAQRFGPLEDRNVDEKPTGAAFEVPEVSNVRPDGTVSDEMDLHTLNLKANQLWHTDSTFLPVPALSNILVARVITAEGGETEVASTRAAWTDMPEDMRSRLRDARLRHRYAHSRARISTELARKPMFHKWPDRIWPAVWRNPVNGTEAVYIASHACAVEGLDADTGTRLIEKTIAFCTRPDYVYTHRWREGDVLIWDERATLHRGRPWPYDQPRRLASICSSVTEADGLLEMRSDRGDDA